MPGAHNSPPARFRIKQFISAFKTLDYNVKLVVPFPDRVDNFPSGYAFMNKITNARLRQLLRVASTWWKLRSVKNGDVVVSNRDIVPELKVIWFEKKIKAKGAKLIFDFDDAIFVGPRGKKLEKIFPIADYLVAGNNYLLNYAKTQNKRSTLIPTVVDTDFYTQKDFDKPNDKVIVGWSGSASTNKVCLPIVKDAIEELSSKMDFTFLVISNENPNLDWNVKDIQFKQWTPDTEVEGIQMIDIGLMPLNDNEFEKGKCGLKAVQYMAVGTPAIVSPVGVNEKIVSHGVDGYHVNNYAEWAEHIGTLVQDGTKRKQMGLAARLKVEEQYSLKRAFVKWQEVLNNL